MPNPFVHVELNTTDLPKAKAFYSKLFAWELEDMPMATGTYTLIKPGNGTGGGMMKHPMPGAPSTWLAYVQVDDINAGAARVNELGGKAGESMPVPNMGWFATCTDPHGNEFGLSQTDPSAPMPEG